MFDKTDREGSASRYDGADWEADFDCTHNVERDAEPLFANVIPDGFALLIAPQARDRRRAFRYRDREIVLPETAKEDRDDGIGYWFRVPLGIRFHPILLVSSDGSGQAHVFGPESPHKHIPLEDRTIAYLPWELFTPDGVEFNPGSLQRPSSPEQTRAMRSDYRAQLRWLTSQYKEHAERDRAEENGSARALHDAIAKTINRVGDLTKKALGEVEAWVSQDDSCVTQNEASVNGTPASSPEPENLSDSELVDCGPSVPNMTVPEEADRHPASNRPATTEEALSKADSWLGSLELMAQDFDATSLGPDESLEPTTAGAARRFSQKFHAELRWADEWLRRDPSSDKWVGGHQAYHEAVRAVGILASEYQNCGNDLCAEAEYLRGLKGSVEERRENGRLAQEKAKDGQKHIGFSQRLREQRTISQVLKLARTEPLIAKDPRPGECLESITLAELAKKQIPALQWIVPGLLPEGLTIIAGPPKAGKSFLTYGLALSVATGKALWGHLATTCSDVLYLALEDSNRRLLERAASVGQFPDGLHIMTEFPVLDSAGNTLGLLERWLDNHPACQLIVVDTFIRIRPQRRSRDIYQDDCSMLAPLHALAQRRHLALVLVYHTSKTYKGESGDWVEKISGTLGGPGTADTLMLLTRNRSTQRGRLDVSGRDVSAVSLALEFSEDAESWILLGDASEYLASPEQREILGLLRGHGPHQPKALAEALHKNPNTVRRLLSKLLNKGLVSKLTTGEYQATRESHPGGVA